MDDKLIKTWNGITALIIIIVLLFAWFYMPAQFMWAVILAILLIILALLVNVRKRLPWRGLTTDEVVLAIIALLILGFAWFYMPAQFAWAAFDVALLLLLGELYLVVTRRKLR